MIDIVIPFINSKWNNQELKYALRGVDKHLSNVGKVFIIGDDPGLQNITVIPCDNDEQRVFKERNIYRKLMAACISKNDISDPFLFMNDDHFLTSDYDAGIFPNYYGKWKTRSDMYGHTQLNTLELMPDAKFFDVHCPMLIDKARFKDKMECVDWDKKAGYCLKTLYAHGLQGEHYEDLKIRLQYPVQKLREMIYGGKWFSICDGARGPELEQVLKELYPIKSKYEI